MSPGHREFDESPPAREPEFRDLIDTLTAASAEIAQRNLAALLPAGPWLDWAARVVPVFTVEAAGPAGD